ncbi:hypothetical protein FB157_12077 [Streptomyces sp. BK340]|nr:hypothetical protein FB157_12077 [Streptomyces sp. BK340]
MVKPVSSSVWNRPPRTAPHALPRALAPLCEAIGEDLARTRERKDSLPVLLPAVPEG